MKLQILGTGCSRCKTLTTRVQEAVATLAIEAEVTKIESFEEIAKFGVMSTPALALDGKILFAGRVPTVREISELINSNVSK